MFSLKKVVSKTYFALPKTSVFNFSGCGNSNCKNKRQQAVIRKEAPQFTGMAFWNGEFKKISLNDFAGKYVVLFFYPLDNTFVCPTEIVAFNDSAKEFEKINTQLIACSIDSHFSHREWALKPRNEGGLNPVNIPMLSDLSQNIAKDYGVRVTDEDLEGVALRGTFVIDKKGVLRHSSVNDLPVGRNVDEVLRIVRAFQHVDEHGEVCHATWTPGKSGMTPGNSDKLKEFWKNEHSKKH